MSSEQTNIKNFLDCDHEKLGCKVYCYACHASFYDLKQEDPVCPYCQTLYSKMTKQRSKKTEVNIEEVIDSTDEDMDFEI